MRAALALALVAGFAADRVFAGRKDESGPLIVVLFDVSRSTDDPDDPRSVPDAFETRGRRVGGATTARWSAT